MTPLPRKFAAGLFPFAGMGDCFRCDRAGLQVIQIGELIGPAGTVPLFACRACTDRLIGCTSGLTKTLYAATCAPPRTPTDCSGRWRTPRRRRPERFSLPRAVPP